MEPTAQLTAQERATIRETANAIALWANRSALDFDKYDYGLDENTIVELEAKIFTAITAAAADERERCARVVIDRGMRSGEEIIASIMAQDIRALGETK